MQRTRPGDRLASRRTHLEPFWEDVDGVIGRRLRQLASARTYGYFEACRVKLKAVYYHAMRVEDLDAQYGDYIDALLEASDRRRFVDNADRTWSYHPFFEAMEFESLLLQAKACIDVFARGTGSAFGDPASKLPKLIQVLKRRSQDTHAVALLKVAEEAQLRLKGLVLDPEMPKSPRGPARKSVRDLIGHDGAGAIHFRVDRQGRRSQRALMRPDARLRIPVANQSVVSLSKHTWYQIRVLITMSLPIVVEMLEE